MKTMKKDFFLAAGISFFFLSIGFALLHADYFDYGIAFFVALPFSLGYVLGSPTIKKNSWYGLIGSLILFCLILLGNNLEGLVCILLAMPLVLIAILVGFIIKALFSLGKKSSSPNNEYDDLLDDNLLKSSVVPLLIVMIIGTIEKQMQLNPTQIVEVSSSIVLPYSPMQVYETIKSVDTLDAPKPFLMQLDLPVPQKCILEEEKVGGLRTCYFEGGTIVERITALEKGKLLQMDVIDYELTGRKWLGFREAIYTFDELPNGHCKMTRITTYSSHLYPRTYWEPLERMGIEQEHQYVFNNLEKDLSHAY